MLMFKMYFFLFLSIKYSINFHMCVHALPACIACACGGQKRTQDPLDLELEMFESYHVYAGGQFQVL